MPNNPNISDDPGTILDSFADVSKMIAAARAVHPGMPPVPVKPPLQPLQREVDEVLYRSPYRSAVPRITICDDGSLETGELVHVRAERIVIGRATGDIQIPHDAAMSASHAEIVRADVGGRHAWVLKDLGSSNGTLARCKTVTLRPGMVLQIGSKRFRFEPFAVADGMPPATAAEPKTTLIGGMMGFREDNLPAFVEHSVGSGKNPRRYPFRSLRVTIGRPEFMNDIELDDLCVAKIHAVVTRDASGTWQLEAQPSLNGIWVKVDAIKLSDNCLFQCGEQRFRFLF